MTNANLAAPPLYEEQASHLNRMSAAVPLLASDGRQRSDVQEPQGATRNEEGLEQVTKCLQIVFFRVWAPPFVPSPHLDQWASWRHPQDLGQPLIQGSRKCEHMTDVRQHLVTRVGNENLTI